MSQTIKTPHGNVEVPDGDRLEYTNVSKVLDEVAKTLGMGRWNSVFAEEPDVEFDARLRQRCTVGEFKGRYEELWNEAADRLYGPVPTVGDAAASMTAAVVMEIKLEEKL